MQTIGSPAGSAFAGGMLGLMGSIALLGGATAIGIHAPIDPAYAFTVKAAFSVTCAVLLGTLAAIQENGAEIPARLYRTIAGMKGENAEIDDMIAACRTRGRMTVRDYNRIAVRRTEIDLEEARATVMETGNPR